MSREVNEIIEVVEEMSVAQLHTMVVEQQQFITDIKAVLADAVETMRLQAIQIVSLKQSMEALSTTALEALVEAREEQMRAFQDISERLTK